MRECKHGDWVWVREGNGSVASFKRLLALGLGSYMVFLEIPDIGGRGLRERNDCHFVKIIALHVWIWECLNSSYFKRLGTRVSHFEYPK